MSLNNCDQEASGVSVGMKRKLYEDGKQLTEEYMSIKNNLNELKRAGKILRSQIEKSEKNVEDFSKTLHDFLIIAVQGIDQEECEDDQKNDKTTKIKSPKLKIKKLRKEVEGSWICPSCSKPVKPTNDGKVKKTHSKNNACSGGGSDAIRTDNKKETLESDKKVDEKL